MFICDAALFHFGSGCGDVLCTTLQYNFREHVLRRTRQEFRLHRTERDATMIEALLKVCYQCCDVGYEHVEIAHGA